MSGGARTNEAMDGASLSSREIDSGIDPFDGVSPADRSPSEELAGRQRLFSEHRFVAASQALAGARGEPFVRRFVECVGPETTLAEVLESWKTINVVRTVETMFDWCEKLGLNRLRSVVGTSGPEATADRSNWRLTISVGGVSARGVELMLGVSFNPWSESLCDFDTAKMEIA